MVTSCADATPIWVPRALPLASETNLAVSPLLSGFSRSYRSLRDCQADGTRSRMVLGNIRSMSGSKPPTGIPRCLYSSLAVTFETWMVAFLT